MTEVRTAHPAPVIGQDRLTPEDVAALASGGSIRVAEHVNELLASARAVVDGIIARDEPAYGVTRGLGPLRDQAIPAELQHDFQRFVFASHDAAVGPVMSREEARAVIVARVAVIARGSSGATQTVLDGLLQLLEHNIIPAIPSEGSIGSADLSLLATVGRVLLGEGFVLGTEPGQTIPAAEALAAAGIAPIRLAAKDAHSLVVANSATIGLSCLASVRLHHLAAAADLAAASTVEALLANTNVFADDLMRARPHPGQIVAAARMRDLLADDFLTQGDVPIRSLQDPLSIRTIPQVHGALLEQHAQLHDTLTIELNSMSENPYIDREGDRMVPNGNFSSIRLSLSLEATRLVLAHIAMVSERRISLMIGQLRSGRNLVEQITSYTEATVPLVPVIFANTASALLSRIQQLAAPVSILGAGVGDGVEDHNAQSYSAVRLLNQSLELVELLLSIEVIVATGVAAARPDAPRQRSDALERLHRDTLNALCRAGDTTDSKVQAVRSLLNDLARETTSDLPDLAGVDRTTHPKETA